MGKRSITASTVKKPVLGARRGVKERSRGAAAERTRRGSTTARCGAKRGVIKV